MKKIISAALAISLCSCASTQAHFYANRYQISDESLCRTWLSDSTQNDYAFNRDVSEEAIRRGFNYSSCQTVVASHNQTIGTVLAATALVAVAVAVAKNGGGGGSSYASSSDYAWAWDQQPNQYGQRVWVCRGKQSGQYANTSQCAGQLQIDSEWPYN